jgi:hypothetical protein
MLFSTTALFVLVSVIFGFRSTSFAQDNTPTPQPGATALPVGSSPDGVAELTFQQFGYSALELRTPIDVEELVMSFPNRWVLSNREAFVELHFDLFYEETTDAGRDLDSLVVDVYLDDQIVTTLIPNPGSDQTLRFPVPSSAFADPFDTVHRLRFTLSAGEDCQYLVGRMVIRESSFIHVSYSTTPPQLRLSSFPLPMLQQLFQPESVLLVLPDSLSAASLEYSASVAAAIGARSFGDLAITSVTAGNVTAEMLENTSVIAVGTPAENSFINDLYLRNLLPTNLAANGTIQVAATGQDSALEDGLLQEIISPVNPDQVYLIVTGSTEEGVARAARALSVTQPTFGLNNSVALIESVSDETEQPAADNLISLQEMGLTQETVYGLETRTTTVTFFIPANWELTGDPILHLTYLHAAGISSSTSNLTVLLNGSPGSSVPLGDANIRAKSVDIELPLQDLRPGRNRLTFETVLTYDTPCISLDLVNPWVRIFNTSSLEIPYIEVADDQLPLLASEKPLEPLLSRADLRDVWFSLSESPTQAEVEGMLDLAWRMGEITQGFNYHPQVSLGEVEQPAETLARYHVLVIGLPSENPIIAEVNDVLPLPFVPSENTIRQEYGSVIYRLPADISLGVIEMIRSPWSDNHVVTVVTGTTEQGLQWVLDAMFNEEPYTDLTIIGENEFEALRSADMLRGAVGAIEEAVGETVELEEVVPTPISAAAPTLEPGVEGDGAQPLVESSAFPFEPSKLAVVLLLGGLFILVLGTLISTRVARKKAQGG